MRLSIEDDVFIDFIRVNTDIGIAFTLDDVSNLFQLLFRCHAAGGIGREIHKNQFGDDIINDVIPNS